MKAIPLTAKDREIVGKKVKKLRAGGEVPATVYGKDLKSQSLLVDLKEFAKVFSASGETGLVDLKVGAKTIPVLIAQTQKHPVSHQILHVQFHAVKLTEKIKAHAPVELVGESPKVASNEGLLLQTLNEVEVESLPTDLPEKITVDVSSLTEIGQQITVGELPKVSGVEILTPAGEIIVKLDPAISAQAKKEAEEAEQAKKAAEEAATAAGTAPAEGTQPAQTPAAETKEEEKKE
jgi:large subunit ribosomal protein L25